MRELKPKKVQESAVNDHVYKLFPNDMNSNGTAFGGMIMSVIDRVALVVAERHADCVCVTVSVDSIHFLAPAGEGDVLIFKASVNRVWNTSMEIGIKVVAENLSDNSTRHIVSAYSTFVALDENRRPVTVSPVVPETLEERRRYQEAEMRRQRRKLEAEERKQLRKTFS